MNESFWSKISKCLLVLKKGILSVKNDSFVIFKPSTVVGVYRGQAYRGHFAIFRKNYLGVYRGHFENDRLPDFLSLMKRRSQLVDYKTSQFSDILYFTRKFF